MKLVTTFSSVGEYEKAVGQFRDAGLPFETIGPFPQYSCVEVPALVVDPDVREEMTRRGGDFVCCGWVGYVAPSAHESRETSHFDEDVFGNAFVMVVGSCVGDRTKLRAIAHLSGDLTDAFPYMNAEVPGACYNHRGPSFTFMEQYRLITLYSRRVAIAKADDIVDVWRILEMARMHSNSIWNRRNTIEPSYEVRERPPALEIYRRLPGTNCGACGERTCMAFALQLRGGFTEPQNCRPIFSGEYAHFKEPLLQLWSALGHGAGAYRY